MSFLILKRQCHDRSEQYDLDGSQAILKADKLSHLGSCYTVILLEFLYSITSSYVIEKKLLLTEICERENLEQCGS